MHGSRSAKAPRAANGAARAGRRPPPLAGALLLLALVACGRNGCSCLSASDAPLPEPERIYDAVQVHVTAEGFAKGIGNLAGPLADILPYSLSFQVPSTNVSGPSGTTVTVCANGCYVYGSLGGATVDRNTPDKLVLKTYPRISGTLELSGAVTCSVGLSFNPEASLELVLQTDPITKFLGATVGAAKIPVVPADFVLTPDSACASADLTPVQDALAAMQPQLEQALHDDAAGSADSYLCLDCSTFTGGCPAGSTCQAGFCRDSANKCLLAPVGTLGVADFQALSPTNYRLPASLELQVVAGQKDPVGADPIVEPSTAATFRFFGGVLSPKTPVDCVDGKLPALGTARRLDLDVEAAKLTALYPKLASPYHLGIALSDALLTRLVQGAWSGGALCLEAAPSVTSLLSAEAIGALLPSTATVADPHAPAILDIRARLPPKVVVGAGEYGLDESGNRALTKPLATAYLDGLELSVYTVVAERYVRLLAVQADARVPFAVEQVVDANGDPALQPVLGSLDGLANNLKVTHSELLAEKPEAIVSAVKTMLGLTQQAIAGNLVTWALPNQNGVALTLVAAHGVGQKAAPDEFDAVGLFANVKQGFPQSFEAETTASVVSLDDLPPGAGAPTVHLSVASSGGPGEFQVRIDGGLWSIFRPTGAFALADPTLALPGEHRLEVRARPVDAPLALDRTPVALTVHVERPGLKRLLRARETLGVAAPAPEELAPSPVAEAASGCSTAPGALGALGLVGLLGLVRRRR